MAKKAAAELPANINELSEITAVIFSQLYESFPVDRNLDPTEIARALGISDINANLLSGRSFPVTFPIRYSFSLLGGLDGIGVNKFGIFDGVSIRSVLAIQFRMLQGHFVAAMGALTVL